MAKEFDLVVWGASGFTGLLACEFIAKTYGLASNNFRYAIAGRSKERLNAVENNMVGIAKSHDKAYWASSIPKILANVDDDASIESMCKRAKCVISMVGPYSKFGEPVVKACAENGTHYIDATGETQWLKKMIELYSETAKDMKSKIIPSCGGGDFIPSDASMLYLANLCEQKGYGISSVQQYIEYDMVGLSGGTLRSIKAIFRPLSFRHIRTFVNDTSVLCKDRPPKSLDKLPWRLSYLPDLNRWSVTSFICPPKVGYLRWSNQIQNFAWNPHIQIGVSELCPSFFGALSRISMRFLFPSLAFLSSRMPVSFLYPAAGKGTFNPKKMKHPKSTRVISVAKVINRSTGKPKKLVVELNFPYETYSLTGMCVVESGMATVFEETPPVYGVVSPSASLGSSLLARLQQQNVVMKTIADEDD